jgi:hypothetical protein
MGDKDLLDPQQNDLIPQGPSLEPIVSMTIDQMSDALAASEGYASDLGDGLTVDRGPVESAKDGLHVYRNGIIVRDLFTLTSEELEKVRKFLQSRGNDLIPPE